MKYSKVVIQALWRKPILRIFCVCCVLLLFIYILWPSIVLSEQYSPIIYDRTGEVLRIFLDEKQQWHLPPDFYEVSLDKVTTTLMWYEDKRFYQHSGIDFFSIIRAIKQNIIAGYVVSGASTISMQAIRLNRTHKPTIIYKIMQMIQALILERDFSKEHIIRWYLMNAPYGGNIQGIQSASYYYFGYGVDMLTWAQASFLSVIPQQPQLIETNRARLLEKRNYLLQVLHKNTVIDAITYKNALQEPLPTQVYSFTQRAWHITQRLTSQVYREKRIDTSIDYALQTRFQHVLARKHMRLKQLNIENYSVMAMDNSTGEVLVYIGSQGYFLNSGMVDGITATFSTGSTSKPFLYANALDKGIISQKSIVWDVPLHLTGGFSPHNASRTFSGIVRVDDALRASLNVPFVRLLQKYGYRAFYSDLQALGFKQVSHGANTYGLSLILGGFEASLEELVGAYSAFARNGERIKPRLRLDAPYDTKKVMSPGAAYLTYDTLRRSLATSLHNTQMPDVAWKTGTSYGLRDTWVLGFNKRYTLGIWIGSFAGKTSSNLSSLHISAPIFFELFALLSDKSYPLTFPEKHLKKTMAYAHTGFAPSHVKAPLISVYMPHDTLLQKDILYQNVWITKKQDSISSIDPPIRSLEARIVYPSDVAHFLQTTGQRMSIEDNNTIPNIIRITYPTNGAQLFLSETMGTLSQFIVQASNINTQLHENFFWYVNDVFIAHTNNPRISLQLHAGTHQLMLISTSGAYDTIEFTIHALS